MFSARALRCAHVPNVARRTALHPLYKKTSIRLSSSSSTGATVGKEQNTQVDAQTASASSTAQKQRTQDVAETKTPQQEKVEALKPRTDRLDEYLGVENMNKAKELSTFTKLLAYELNKIYGHQRFLKRLLRGMYRVRDHPFTPPGGRVNIPRTEFREDKLYVDSRLIPNIWLRDNCQCGSCMHDTATGDLLRVRWNSSDRASIELPIEEVETWYDAARKFDAILKKKENEYWEQLVPGRVLIFDNWRVLHGRSSFTGKRRICGGYVNRDDWISKFKMLEFGSEDVLKGLAVN